MTCIPILCIGTQKSPPPTKLLELISKFSIVTGYKTNIQKSVAFPYTNNEWSERGSKKIIPFTITSKRMKYLRINLTKETKDLYCENYKTLMKEIEDDTKNGKLSQVHGLEE